MGALLVATAVSAGLSAAASASSDLAIGIAAPSGGLAAGVPGTLSLSVSNRGPDSTSGTTTVTDTLPSSLAFVSADGPGWSCTTGQTFTCTSSDAVPAGAGYSPIDVVVMPSLAAMPSVSYSANVAYADDANPLNNDATASVRVARWEHDLALKATHTVAFAAGTAATLRLSVSNVGAASTAGPTTVTDRLPPDLTFLSASGTGWTCPAPPPGTSVVTCTSTQAVRGGTAFRSLSLRILPALTIAPTVTNSATVASAGDQDATNDAATDTINVRRGPDVTLHIAPPHRPLRAAARATFSLTLVSNRVIRGATTVAGTLPRTVALVAVKGTGWTCARVHARRFSCRTSATRSLHPLALTVEPRVRGPLTLSATVTNAGDKDHSDDMATFTGVVHRGLTLPRMRARFAFAKRVSDHTRVLTGVRIRGVVRRATLTIECVAGCHRRVLATATTGLRRRVVRIHLAHPLRVAGRTVALVERRDGFLVRTQRSRFRR